MKMPRSWSIRGLVIVVRLLRAGYWISLLFFASVLVASAIPRGRLVAHLATKYAGRADPVTAVHLLQGTLVIGVVAVFILDKRLRALNAVADSAGDGDPFHAANADRLQTIGFALLMLQLLDLALGRLTLLTRRVHVDALDWQPSFIGWIMVLVAFVLARVFREGAAMRADLDGTV